MRVVEVIEVYMSELPYRLRKRAFFRLGPRSISYIVRRKALHRYHRAGFLVKCEAWKEITSLDARITTGNFEERK